MACTDNELRWLNSRIRISMATNNQVNVGLSGQTGTGSFVGSTSPTLVTPTLGVASATSINFGGTTLSNYLQGTWTPTLTFATPGDLSVSYSTQTGVQTRIGNLIVASFTVIGTPTYTTASGQLQIGGLTVAASQTNDTGSLGAQSVGITYPAGCTKICFVTTATATTLSFVGMGSVTASVALTTANAPTAVAITFAGTIVYHV